MKKETTSKKMVVTYPIFQFGNNYAPSKLVKVIDEFDMLKVRMTSGGGVGGALWFEYIKPIEFPTTESIIKVENIFGEEITINTHYVVKVEEYHCIKVEEDITEWRRKFAPSSKEYINYLWYAIKSNQQYQFVPNKSFYGDDRIKKATLASSFFENGECVDFQIYVV